MGLLDFHSTFLNIACRPFKTLQLLALNWW